MEAIIAVDKNNGFAKDGNIPWKSKTDMNFFKTKTMGNVIIMGKNTFLSLPDKERPLKGRLNIVLTNKYEEFSNIYNNDNLKEGQTINPIFTNNINSYEYIVKNKENHMALYYYLKNDFKIFVIGGKNIYEQYFPYYDKIWLTRFKTDYNCDKFLELNLDNYKYNIYYEDDELTIYEYYK